MDFVISVIMSPVLEAVLATGFMIGVGGGVIVFGLVIEEIWKERVDKKS